MATDSTIIAFFAALAATPPGETVPTVDAGLLTDSNHIAELKTNTPNLPFWQRFQVFQKLIVKGYTVKPRNKMLRPTGSFQDSEDAAEQEHPNVSLSAEEILNSPKPAIAAQKQYQQSTQAQTPETPTDIDYLEWAKYLLA